MRNGRPVAVSVLALLSTLVLAPAVAHADTITLPGLTITGAYLDWNGVRTDIADERRIFTGRAAQAFVTRRSL